MTPTKIQFSISAKLRQERQSRKGDMGEECIRDGQRQLQASRLFIRMLQDKGKKRREAPGEL